MAPLKPIQDSKELKFDQSFLKKIKTNRRINCKLKSFSQNLNFLKIRLNFYPQTNFLQRLRQSHTSSVTAFADQNHLVQAHG